MGTRSRDEQLEDTRLAHPAPPPTLPPTTPPANPTPTNPTAPTLPTFGPPAPPTLRGPARFSDEVNRAGYQAESEQYDAFVLKMIQDPTAPDYSYLVRVNQEAARPRQERRRPTTGAPNTVDGRPEFKTLREQDAYFARHGPGGQVFLDKNGREFTPSGPVKATKPGQTADMTQGDTTTDVEISSPDDFIAAGGAVWVGNRNTPVGDGRS